MTWLYIPFESTSVIFRQSRDDYERLCGMKHYVGVTQTLASSWPQTCLWVILSEGDSAPDKKE